jgi:hypothetical protein
MATIDVIRERPPIDLRSSGGGGGEGDGPHDQTPIKPTHAAEVGTGLALVRGPGGEMRKEILANITHADLLAWGRTENATEVKWVTPRLASEQQVRSESARDSSPPERCVDTCVTPGKICNRETGICS